MSEQVLLLFIFRNSFLYSYHYCFLYHGDQNISWWRTCRWRAVNFEIRLCSSGVNSDLEECFFWDLCKPMIASVDLGLWPQEMFNFFGNAYNGRVWKEFQCLHLSKGAHQRLLLLLTFHYGNKVFDFWRGFLVKILKTMNHFKTRTMVSMETKVVSRDSFLDKFSEKLYLNGFWEGYQGFCWGEGGGGAQCAPPPWCLEHKNAWLR